MNLLVQFLLRLVFGLATAMAITSARQVTSGYFRNHLYVTLGLSALAAVVSYALVPAVFWFAVGAALFSYVGAVCWLYEKPVAGKTALVLVALAAVSGAVLQWTSSAVVADGEAGRPEPITLATQDDGEATSAAESAPDVEGSKWGPLNFATVVTSGLLLGVTIASMLLGHWYLNSPTMELVPLQRLIVAMGVAVAAQSIVSALGLWHEWQEATDFQSQWLWFLVLRWSFGLAGVAILAWMAWQTLKIPNTQSATGILYVAVIGTFVGESMALLLSAKSLYPL